LAILAGVDALTIGFHMKGWPDEPELDSKQGASRKDRQAFTVEERVFFMTSHGQGMYRWAAYNEDFRILIARDWKEGKNFPEVMVTPNSKTIWALGPWGAYRAAYDIADTIGEVVGHTFSRIDLCVDQDIALPDLRKTPATGYVKKKRGFQIEEYATGKRPTGYMFGSGALVGRLYDKLYEQRNNQDTSTLDRLIGYFGPDAPVTRFELQYRREALAAHNIDNILQVESGLSDLWKWGTTSWLTLRDNNSHATRLRDKPISPEWASYQQATNAFTGTPATPINPEDPSTNPTALIRQAAGCILSAANRITTIGVDPETARRVMMSLLQDELSFKSRT
jgi:hypothetical protein